MGALRTRLESMSEWLTMLRLSGKFGGILHDASERNDLFRRLEVISQTVSCPHFHSEILTFGLEILTLPEKVKGVVVEAGCFKGGSTAKFSIFAQLAGRELVGFDSFEGLPDNQEAHHQSILGRSIEDEFRGGEYCGRLEEVESNVREYGEIDVCRFVQGWFEETLPRFNEPIAAAFVDVDLAESTRTCLKYLYPLISPGGTLYSQDGDFPLVIEVFSDDAFWELEVGCKKPVIEGLGKKKLLRIRKEG